MDIKMSKQDRKAREKQDKSIQTRSQHTELWARQEEPCEEAGVRKPLCWRRRVKA